MKKIVYRKISCLVTNEGVAANGGVRPLEKDLGLISNGAIVHSEKEGILWTGPDKNLPKIFRGKSWRHVDCRGLTGYPGLVDSHTHPVFAGDRALEFELRMKGSSYQEIAEAGGGILTSVEATRKTSSATLQKLLEQRILTAKRFGVRLLEAKSGYGLDFDTEVRSLQVIGRSKKKNLGVEMIATCMAAHAIPPEMRNRRGDFIEMIKQKILPIVAKKKLAEYVDVFCDSGYFTVDETLEIIRTAQTLKLSARIHGEELSLTGIAAKAAELGVHSVDHLLKVDDKGARAMAMYGTVATLLPGTALYLREPPAPARKLIDLGVVVSLASDFNPGSCPTQNLPFIGTLAAILLGMTTAEIIAALTWNAARSLRRESRFGTLLPGAKGEPVFANGEHPSALFYAMAPSELPDPCNSAL